MFVKIMSIMSSLIIPVTMIISGKIFENAKPPSDFKTPANKFFDTRYLSVGYKSYMALRSKETYVFAHRYCFRRWLVYGLVLLPFSIIPALFVKENETLTMLLSTTVIIQSIGMIIPVIQTEIQLRKRFDRNGNPKE